MLIYFKHRIDLNKAHLFFCTPEEVKFLFFFFFQAEDGIRDIGVTGVQTCALPISARRTGESWPGPPPASYQLRRGRDSRAVNLAYAAARARTSPLLPPRTRRTR